MKATKKSLWLSAVSMMLCALMLLGTTFAWFTDNVTNKGNVIQAGNLDAELRYRDVKESDPKAEYTTVTDETPALFGNQKWEPGYSYGYDFCVMNKGTLAFDWELTVVNLKMDEKTAKIADVLEVYTSGYTNDGPEKLEYVDTLANLVNNNGGVIRKGQVWKPGNGNYFSVVIKMKEDADNDYQGANVTFDVVLRAKQAAVEEDGFGSSDYDANATYSVTSQEEMQDAIDRAEDGAIIALANDLTVDDSVVFQFNTAKAVTIDLSGNTITYNNPANAGALVYARNGADVTLQNGTINMDNPYYGLLVNENSSLTVKGVTVNSGDSVIFSNGKNINVVVEDSTLSAQYYAVYHNGSYAPANVTIRNSTILSGGVYVSNSAGREKQTLTIENSTIYGPTAVEMKHTNATITNSTLVGTVAPTGSGSNNNGGCTAGYAFAVTGNGVNDLATGTVVVTDCKFFSEAITDEPNGYYFVYKLAEGSSVTIDGTSVDDFNSYEN